MHFYTHFSRKVPPSPQQQILNSPLACFLFCVCISQNLYRKTTAKPHRKKQLSIISNDYLKSTKVRMNQRRNMIQKPQLQLKTTTESVKGSKTTQVVKRFSVFICAMLAGTQVSSDFCVCFKKVTKQLVVIQWNLT